MNLHDDWPLLALFLFVGSLFTFLFWSMHSSERRHDEFAARCERVGGVAIKNGGESLCVAEFADMRQSTKEP